MNSSIYTFGDSRLPQRFWSKATVLTNGCWQWSHPDSSGGYGRFQTDRADLAHRVIYAALVAPIPSGQTVDHLCRNRGCQEETG